MKKYICGLLSGMLIMTAIPAFAETTQSISAIFGRVKLIVNGSTVNQETLLYNGTTYVPLRAVSEILDKEVQYDANTKTAYIDNAGTNRTITSQNDSLSDDDLTDADIELLNKSVDFMETILENEDKCIESVADEDYTSARKHLKLALDANAELEKINLTPISAEMNTTLHNFTKSINSYLNGYIKVIDLMEKGSYDQALEQYNQIEKHIDDTVFYLEEFDVYFE